MMTGNVSGRAELFHSPAHWALGLVLAMQAGLAAGLLTWAGWVAGVVLSLPMLLPLWGLLRARPRSAAWAAYLMIFYVAGLLSEAYAMPERHEVALILSIVALVAFFSLILFVRWTARERRLIQPAAGDAAGQKESSDGAGR